MNILKQTNGSFDDFLDISSGYNQAGFVLVNHQIYYIHEGASAIPS